MHWVRAVGLLLGGLGLLAGEVPAEARRQAPPPAASLSVLLTTSPRVPGTARSALMDEATRIWQQAGVRIDWVSPPTSRPAAGNTLRLLAVQRPAVQPRTRHTVVLGELHRVNATRALAMVSVNEAERIASQVRGLRAAAFSDHVGVVLGRAAAHEIGHYLLNTSTHAAQGLMRPRFDAAEVADPLSGAFLLDDQASAWVRQRVARGLPLGPAAGSSVATRPIALPGVELMTAFSYGE